ncbi:MAG TPA: FAD-binding protein [Gemmatales bacterium]|nr:FAD-binding protein [Gemmatales bacterium]HMP16067.1 FAD-binding protein [Gemmatales bacterium]
MASLAFLDSWKSCVQRDADIAPLTSLRLGGKAGALVQPPDTATLTAIIQAANKHRVEVRFLGSGSNILVQDAGFPGIVIQFSNPGFQAIQVVGNRLLARTGATLQNLVATAARHQLGGLESLVSLPGTVGGALKNDLKVKTGPLSQFVSRVELLDSTGKATWHNRDELPIDQILSTPDGVIILGAEFLLHQDPTEAVIKRLRKNWIHLRNHMPLNEERAARLFKDPPGGSASQLIVKASAQLNKVGGASLSERDSNYVVVNQQASSTDVLALMEKVAAQVEERLGEVLQPSLVVW